MKNFILLIALSFSLIGCGTIDSNNVGVRTTWTGEILIDEIDQGFYTAWTESVDEYSAKEITINLADMTPKAGDNLTLADFDAEVWYTMDRSQIADNKLKYANSDVCTGGICYPGFLMVKSFARSSIYDVVAQYDSLKIHVNRELIGNEIKSTLQDVLDKDDAGKFFVKKVIIRNVKTDQSIEQSIKLAVAKNKELEAKTIELEIANKQVEINNSLDASLTASVLRQRELDVQLAALESTNANVTFIIGGGNIQPLVNLK